MSHPLCVEWLTHTTKVYTAQHTAHQPYRSWSVWFAVIRPSTLQLLFAVGAVVVVVVINLNHKHFLYCTLWKWHDKRFWGHFIFWLYFWFGFGVYVFLPTWTEFWLVEPNPITAQFCLTAVIILLFLFLLPLLCCSVTLPPIYAWVYMCWWLMIKCSACKINQIMKWKIWIAYYFGWWWERQRPEYFAFTSHFLYHSLTLENKLFRYGV